MTSTIASSPVVWLRGVALTLTLFAVQAAHAQAAARAGATKAAAPPSADSSLGVSSGRQSWTSDKMRYGIGDIITILIDERTLASTNLTDNNTENRRKSMGLDIEPPAAPGGISSSMSVTTDFGNNGDSRKSGVALRQNAFRSQVSARVIGVSPTGMLHVRGHKLVNVDKNEQDVVVSGWIRPQDVSVGSNSIESSRIADAQIDYTQKGALGRPRSGIISRVLGGLWP